MRTHGIHHVTAIVGNPRENFEFYGGILGLRLVKKTVNFDDPYTYHLYYGDESGNPGSIITFFPWQGNALKGRRGSGQLTTTAYSIPAAAISFWKERLENAGITVAGPFLRFNEEVLVFDDPHGLEIELVGAQTDVRSGVTAEGIDADKAIRGFHSVTLTEANIEATARLMTSLLDFEPLDESEDRYRLKSGSGDAGTLVDLLHKPAVPPGSMGVGVVHHVAWRSKDDPAQLALRQELANAGLQVSPVMDRNYFHSIYFREPGGVLFEVATDPPGFTVDESPETLGSELKLPEWLEPRRQDIEMRLPKLSAEGDK